MDWMQVACSTMTHKQPSFPESWKVIFWFGWFQLKTIKIQFEKNESSLYTHIHVNKGLQSQLNNLVILIASYNNPTHYPMQNQIPNVLMCNEENVENIQQTNTG